MKALSVARLLAALALAAPLLTVSPAHAGGNVRPAKNDLEESNGGWKLFVTIKLPKKPASPHQTMRFLFRPVVIFETFLDDTKPGEQTRMLNQDPKAEPVVISQDVSFGDMSGALFDTTKFDFSVNRDKGMFAGEYKVELRDADDHVIGQPFTLKLGGKNDVIDRRAMVFADSGKKKKAAPTDDKASAPPDPPRDEAGAKPTDPGSPDDKSGDGAAAPPPVEKKAGGCGCELPAGPPSNGPGAFFIAAVALGIARRRRA